MFGISTLAVTGLVGHRLVQALKGKPQGIPKPREQGLDLARYERNMLKLHDLAGRFMTLENDLKHAMEGLDKLEGRLGEHEREDRQVHERIARMEGATENVKEALNDLTAAVRDFRDFTAVTKVRV